MQELLNRLAEILPGLSPKLRQAAGVVLDKPNAVATMSMRELARRAGVTPPTIIRLAKTLGYEEYGQFKRVFVRALDGYSFEQRANQLQVASETLGEATIVAEMMEAGLGNIRDLYQRIDTETICKAADLIIESNAVYVIAASAPHWIAAYMQYVGKMAIPNLRVPRTSGDGLLEGLVPLQDDDLVVAISVKPYSRETIEAVEFALERGGRFIYFTDSYTAPLADRAEVVIQLSTESPQYFPSMAPLIVAIETLLAVVVARRGKAAIGVISEYANIRKRRYINS